MGTSFVFLRKFYKNVLLIPLKFNPYVELTLYWDIGMIFRMAKITPKKIGQFVTLWKRVGDSPIQPFDLSDPENVFVVSVKKENHSGQFVFPKSVLYEQGVVSKNGKGGKRAMRVYPPWDKPTSRQAIQTQKWQLECFVETPEIM